MRPERSSLALRKQKAPGWSASELRCPRSAPEDGSGEDALGRAGLLRPLPMGADACAARATQRKTANELSLRNARVFVANLVPTNFA